MPVRKPKKPSTGRRRAAAAIPSNVIEASRRAAEGAGSRFMEAATREPDLGHGLPVAPKPIIAVTPADIRRRTAQKKEANRRKGAANNVRGYVRPGGVLPPAITTPIVDEQGNLISAEDLLRLTSDQQGAPTAIQEGTYHFPQVSPTKTINPPRPRTLEAGWERIVDQNHPSYPGILRVRFRDGTPWEYHQVESAVWQRFKRVQSPGRFINRVLNQYPYNRGSF